MKQPTDHVSRNPERKVRIATVRDADEGIMTCSCGWVKRHTRRKVRENAAARHLEKRHDGQGLWL